MASCHYNPLGHENIADLLSDQHGDDLGRPIEPGGSQGDLDIVFVVDTTGSMGGEIAQVRANLAAIDQSQSSRASTQPLIFLGVQVLPRLRSSLATPPALSPEPISGLTAADLWQRAWQLTQCR